MVDGLKKRVTYTIAVDTLNQLKMWVDVLLAEEHCGREIKLGILNHTSRLQVCEYTDNEGVLQRVEIEIVKDDSEL